MTRILIGVLSLIMCSCCASNLSCKKDFKVFNAIMIEDVPNLTMYGMSSIYMIYEDSLLVRDKHNSKELNKSMPSRKNIMKEIERISKLDVEIPICIDIEGWSLELPYINQSVPKYTNLLKEFKQVFPERNIAFYGVIPYADVFLYQANLPSVKRGSRNWSLEWKTINNKLSKIAQETNIAYPSCYTRNKNFNEWTFIVERQVLMAKKLNPDIKVHAFIWPQYFAKGYDYLYDYIDTDIWVSQLEFLYKKCDGIVIWHPPFHPATRETYYWDESASWWLSIIEFIKKYNITSINIK